MHTANGWTASRSEIVDERPPIDFGPGFERLGRPQTCQTLQAGRDGKDVGDALAADSARGGVAAGERQGSEAGNPPVVTARRLSDVAAASGPALVVTTAGAGRAEVLERRIRLLLERGVEPASILVLSGNGRRPTDLVDPITADHPSAAWVETRTFVGFLVQLVREHHRRVKLAAEFTLLPHDETLRHLARDAESVKFARRGEGPAHGENLYSIVAQTTLRPELSIDRVVREQFPGYRGHEGQIERIHQRYREAKADGHCLDHADLVVHAGTLLRALDVRAGVVRRYRHILVDGGESLGVTSLDLIAGLVAEEDGPNLMITANDAQRVETWWFNRGDTVSEFRRRFPAGRHFTATTDPARPAGITALLEAASGSTFARPGHEVVPQKTKESVVTADLARPLLHVVVDEPSQAAFVAAEVARLVRDEGIPVGRQTVLFPHAYQAYGLESPLRTLGVPFHVNGHQRSDRRAHVDQMLAHLQILANFRQRWAWLQALRLVSGVGVRAAERLASAGVAALDPADALADVADVAARHFPRLRHKVAGLTTALTRALRVTAPGAQFDAVLAYAEPLLKRQYKDRVHARLGELDALRPVAARHASLHAFLDSFTVDAPGFAGHRSRGGGVDPAVDAATPLELCTVDWARGRAWDVVHFLLPSTAWLATPASDSAGARPTSERRFICAAAARASSRFVLYAVRSPGTQLAETAGGLWPYLDRREGGGQRVIPDDAGRRPRRRTN